MKILYNATSVRVGGGLTYSRDQVNALAALTDVEVTVVAAPWNHGGLRSVLASQVELLLARVPNVPVRYLWEQTFLPVMARHYDILVSPANFGVLWTPIPQVVILRNANYVGRGRQLPRNRRPSRRAKIALSHLSMRRSDLVVAISDSLASEVRSEDALSAIDLVTVKSGAPRPHLPGEPSSREVTEVVERLVGAEPYLLSVANDYPHKRLDDLAWLPEHIAARDAALPTRVVFVGDISPARRRELAALVGGLEGALVFLGPITDRSTVLQLYGRAAASISTSQLEAFPLTLHEALSQGSPLVVADIAPHRELADGRAHFFPVGDLDALVTAIESALSAPRPDPWSATWSWSDHAAELVAHLRHLTEP